MRGATYKLMLNGIGVRTHFVRKVGGEVRECGVWIHVLHRRDEDQDLLITLSQIHRPTPGGSASPLPFPTTSAPIPFPAPFTNLPPPTPTPDPSLDHTPNTRLSAHRNNITSFSHTCVVHIARVSGRSAEGGPVWDEGPEGEGACGAGEGRRDREMRIRLASSTSVNRRSPTITRRSSFVTLFPSSGLGGDKRDKGDVGDMGGDGVEGWWGWGWREAKYDRIPFMHA